MVAQLPTRETATCQIGDEVSSWLTMKGAVPQGSWLGPLCFIVYVNKIEAEDGMRIHKYIDDITITEQIKHGEVSHLQKSLDTITGSAPETA